MQKNVFLTESCLAALIAARARKLLSTHTLSVEICFSFVEAGRIFHLVLLDLVENSSG